MRKALIAEPSSPKVPELTLVVLGPQGRLYIEGPLPLLKELLESMDSKEHKEALPCPS